MSGKNFQNLTIKNAFLFEAVMEDPSLCASFLSRLLDMEITEVSIVTEKTLASHPRYHGIRLDILAEDEESRRFNVEMQVRFEESLPKRSRYYQSQLDMYSLKKGATYGTLPDSYVIFICDYSLFGESLYRYTYKNICEETGKSLEDGRTMMFLSTKGKNREQIPKPLSNLLDYIGHPEKEDDFTDDPLITAIEARIKAIKNDQIMEDRFMFLEEWIEDERAEARAEAIAETRIEDRKCFSRLLKVLAKRGRTEDLVKAADPDYLEKLFREFGL